MTTALETSAANAAGLAFYEQDYFRHDLRHGTLFNRYGTKMCFMPSELMLALKQILAEETGDAWTGILKRAGRIWGRRVARRFEQEVTAYYGRPLHEMPVRELMRILEGHFAYHGWGDLALDFDRAEHGFIMARLSNSAFVEITGRSPRPVDSLVCGLLSEFFCQLSERTDIDCVETECSAMGLPRCRFVVGIAPRLAIVERMVEQGRTHDEIELHICPESPATDDVHESDTQKMDRRKIF